MTLKVGDRVILAKSILKYEKLPVGAVGTVRMELSAGGEVGVTFDKYHNSHSRSGTFYCPPAWLKKTIGLAPGENCLDAFASLAKAAITDELAYSAKRILDNAFPLKLHRGDAFEFKADPGPISTEWIEIPMFENKKEETPMNTMYNEKNCRVACISFDDFSFSGKTYSYALFLNDVEPGDRVVVRNYNGDLTIGTLARITDDGHDKVKNGCEVICVIDMTEFNKRREQFAKAADLRKKMDARVKALQDIALYEMLAKDDPELANLLSEFKTVAQ